MSSLEFHKCRICGSIFFAGGRKNTYCTKCIPKGLRPPFTSRYINNWEKLQAKRKKDRIYWHIKMSNPEFREKERLRSLKRARAERKYMVERSIDG